MLQILFTLSIQKIRSVWSKLRDYFKKTFDIFSEISCLRTVSGSEPGKPLLILEDLSVFSNFCQLWEALKKFLPNRFQYFFIFWKRLDELCSFLHSFDALDKIKIPYDSNHLWGFCKSGIHRPKSLPCRTLSLCWQ